MSQKKIDERKQSKGDMLHQAKKQMKITVLLVAVVLLAVGGLATAFAYTGGYEKGQKVGYDDGYEFGIAYQKYLDQLSSAQAASKEQASKDKETTAKDDKNDATKDEKETTTASEEKETEASKEDK